MHAASGWFGRSVKRGRRWTAAVIVVIAVSAPACSESDWRDPGERDTSRTMRRSSGEYAKGHRDGRRDAESAWLEDSGGWMWLWMMDPEYQSGYDQGWKDGRNIARHRSQQGREAGRRESKSDDTTAGPKPKPPTVTESE